jgi:hypothetical protein
MPVAGRAASDFYHLDCRFVAEGILRCNEETPSPCEKLLGDFIERYMEALRALFSGGAGWAWSNRDLTPFLAFPTSGNQA